MTDSAAGMDEGREAWELWRQDDNGNRFRITRFATEAQADAEKRRFEALAHKQIYWVERGADDEA
ncbi:MAG TPA: SPOR domain-containing protein [Longimicrobium sp.]|nr:SPOR domain-containing protein [Longimicrobium sp.]